MSPVYIAGDLAGTPVLSHRACAGSAVLRQGVTFSGRRLPFAGTRRVSFAPCVRSNRPHS